MGILSSSPKEKAADIPGGPQPKQEEAPKEAKKENAFSLSDELLKRAVHSPPCEQAWAKGVETTESLSKVGNKSIEQYAGVMVLTVTPKSYPETPHTAFIATGVFFDALNPVSVEEFSKENHKFFLPSQNFAFSIWSLDEFCADVLTAADGWFFWPRTRAFYQVPHAWKTRLAAANAAFLAQRHT